MPSNCVLPPSILKTHIRFFIVVLLTFIFVSGTGKVSFAGGMDTAKVLAQDPPHHIFKTSPMAALLSQIPGTAEMRFLYEGVHGPKYTSMVGVSYIYLSPILRQAITPALNMLPFRIKMNGVRLQGALKHYLFNDYLAPQGIYVGLHGSVNMFKLHIPRNSQFRYQLDNYNTRAYFANASVIWGFQVLFLKLVALDVYWGVGYRYNVLTEHNSGSMFYDVETQRIDLGIAPLPDALKLSFGINMGIAID